MEYQKERWLGCLQIETEYNSQLDKVAEMMPDEPNKIQKALDKELTSKKYKCFGKVKISSKSEDTKRLEVLQAEKLKLEEVDNAEKAEKQKSIDAKMALVLKELQLNKYKKDLKSLDEIVKTKGKSAAIFNLRDRILGSKKAATRTDSNSRSHKEYISLYSKRD